MDEKIDFEPIFATFDKGIVALIKSLLDAEKISYYVDNENAASLAMGSVTGVMTIMVAKNQVDTAKELLREIKEWMSDGCVARNV